MSAQPFRILVVCTGNRASLVRRTPTQPRLSDEQLDAVFRRIRDEIDATAASYWPGAGVACAERP